MLLGGDCFRLSQRLDFFAQTKIPLLELNLARLQAFGSCQRCCQLTVAPDERICMIFETYLESCADRLFGHCHRARRRAYRDYEPRRLAADEAMEAFARIVA